MPAPTKKKKKVWLQAISDEALSRLDMKGPQFDVRLEIQRRTNYGRHVHQ